MLEALFDAAEEEEEKEEFLGPGKAAEDEVATGFFRNEVEGQC